jgi:mono/diheme cytochrome c family protein
MKTNHRHAIRLGQPTGTAFLSLVLVAITPLLMGAIACQRSAEADEATSRETPSAESTPAVVAATDTPSAQPAGPASGVVVNGWKQYEVNCSRCHGQDALGSAFAPDLRARAQILGREAFAGIVKKGKVATGMPAFESQLDDQQVNDIYAYVTARAEGLPPGRPKS